MDLKIEGKVMVIGGQRETTPEALCAAEDCRHRNSDHDEYNVEEPLTNLRPDANPGDRFFSLQRPCTIEGCKCGWFERTI